MTPFTVSVGNSPIILGQPHGGTYVPDNIAARLNDRGRGLGDTDWHINRLYDALLPEATVVQANFHRYVIDANRDPSDVSLYPGQNTTNLCPQSDFDGHAIWANGQLPSADEIEERRLLWHAPYHAALAEQMARVKEKHGVAILVDCHSIRSEIPFLFVGTLPVFSIGTDNGRTCASTIESSTMDIVHNSIGYDHVLNGRFKGGWTTRHYGRPADGFHTLQIELAQRTYMDEVAPWSYHPERAAKLRPYLKEILEQLAGLALSGVLVDQMRRPQ